MKLAVITFSGNVGKTTVARHLLLPRIPDAQLVTIESINADADQVDALTGKQFAALRDILRTRNDVIVDIGASNVEDLQNPMRRTVEAEAAGRLQPGRRWACVLVG